MSGLIFVEIPLGEEGAKWINLAAINTVEVFPRNSPSLCIGIRFQNGSTQGLEGDSAQIVLEALHRLRLLSGDDFMESVKKIHSKDEQLST